MRNLKQAALIADRCAIQRYGLKAKTNFDYTQKDLSQMIVDIKNDFKQNIASDGFVVSFKNYCPAELQLSNLADYMQYQAVDSLDNQ